MNKINTILLAKNSAVLSKKQMLLLAPIVALLGWIMLLTQPHLAQNFGLSTQYANWLVWALMYAQWEFYAAAPELIPEIGTIDFLIWMFGRASAAAW